MSQATWPVRLVVGTSGFHPEGASSILARVTMKDSRDDMWYEFVYDDDGHVRKIIKEQSPIKEISESGFTTYDTSHGHCAFCGSLTCNGSCFR